MSFRPQIRTKHPSQDHLRGSLDIQPNRTVIRLGSTTTLEDIYPQGIRNGRRIIEINTVEAVKNSASKLRMKKCFTRGNVKTAEWWQFIDNRFVMNDNINQITNIENLPYPIVAKSHYGSRGEGNYKLNDEAELRRWMQGKNLSNYIFEKFYNFTREYRIHVTAEGYFYTCRKMLRRDADRNNSWQRHDDNCVWIREENPSFDKPSNWNTIVEHCVRALNATGLDIAGFDVKVQSATNQRGERRENPDFIIIESNSACSHGEITAIKYKEALNRLCDIKNGRNVNRTINNIQTEELVTERRRESVTNNNTTISTNSSQQSNNNESRTVISRERNNRPNIRKAFRRN